MDEPVLLARVANTSLTAGELLAGWTHPDRVIWRSSFGQWHASIRAGASPRPNVEASQPFVPTRFRVDRPEATRCDVLLVGDWRLEDGWNRYGVALAAMLIADGSTVAICQMDSPWLVDQRAPHLRGAAAEAVSAGLPVAPVGSPSHEANLAIVLDPLVLDRVGDDVRGPRADRVALLGSRPLQAGDGRTLADVATVEATTRRVFGAEAVWFPGLRAWDPSGGSGRVMPLPPVDEGGHVSHSRSDAIVVRVPDPDDISVTPAFDGPTPNGAVLHDGREPAPLARAWIIGQLEPTVGALWEAHEAQLRGAVVVAPPSFALDLPEPRRIVDVGSLFRAAVEAAPAGAVTLSRVDTRAWIALVREAGSYW